MQKKKNKSDFTQPLLFDTHDCTPSGPSVPIDADPPNDFDKPSGDQITQNASESSKSQSPITVDAPSGESNSTSFNVSPSSRNDTGQPVLPNSEDLVVVVDSHSLIYQVFHALPPMTSPHGVEVGAVHGFLRDIATILQQWSPTYLICAFDASEETFRNQLYPDYKAHRESMPDALRGQISIIQDALKLLGIPIIATPGFEADDILATIAHRADSRGSRVLLVTSDKDCRQLITQRVSMLNLRKGELFTAKELMEVWAIRPDQVVDFQALVGDSTDNVPGVPSIGPKAAQQLIEQFGSLDKIYANLEKVQGDKKREKLIEYRDAAYLSRDLVRLRIDTPVPEDWNLLKRTDPRIEEIDALFRDLGFRRLSEALMQLINGQRFVQADQIREPASEIMPSSPPAKRLATEGYQTISSLDGLTQLATTIKKASFVAIDTETTSTNPHSTNLVGVSLAWAPGQAAYIPILSPDPAKNIPIKRLQETLAPLLSDPDIKWIGQHVKFDAIVLKNHGMPMENIHFDTMVADYLLDAGGRNHDLGDIAKRWLAVESIPIQDLIGTGKTQLTMDQIPVEQVATYACEDVDIPIRLYSEMLGRIQDEKLDHVMQQLELPLIKVLVGMESIGVRIDINRLSMLRKEFKERVDTLHEEILEIAGETFNPDSPKQLSSILFEKLKLRVIKKTKTGMSTDAEVLEELANEHPLPAKILEYRQMAKLLSTYVDALPLLINKRTDRIHTSYRQDIAATGRLSSVEPNLQNIPIRTAEGRSIRSAFVPGFPNWKLLTADYSQIELRVLAHCCGDLTLRDAFEKGIDIHAAVAAQVHGININQVTSEMRRSAKAISFGILYGQSPFGLAKALGISRADASVFIDQYFAKYPKVREFINNTLVDCRSKGFVTTISGRKRILKGIRDFNSLDDNKKKQLLEPERMAINTVIQGTAADMIKLAMIAIAKRLETANLKANMLLQIHDELVFEVAPEDAQSLSELVREEMESVMPLTVPIRVDVKIGNNWAECDPI